MNKNHSILTKEEKEVNFEKFEQKVLDEFQKLEQKTTLNENEENVGEQLTEVLKQFHIHWNGLRLNGEMDRAKEETKNLMRKIL